VLPNFVQILIFWFVQASALVVFAVPFRWAYLGLWAASHFLRAVGLTLCFHRHMAHRAFKMNRAARFVWAFIGTSAMQKGPLWWAGHHRQHHKYSDQEDDPHSPIVRTVWWAHIGWVISGRYGRPPEGAMRDFDKYPELRLLDTFFTWVPGLLLAALCYLLAGWSGVVWGFVVGTVLLYHGTFLVNSVCHLFGSRRYNTTDQSRNCWWAALLTMGEGWHNNHHHYQSCARQGFKWWEVDVSYYIIRLLGFVGLVWDIREPTERALAANLIEKQPAVEPGASATGSISPSPLEGEGSGTKCRG